MTETTQLREPENPANEQKNITKIMHTNHKHIYKPTELRATNTPKPLKIYGITNAKQTTETYFIYLNDADENSAHWLRSKCK